MAKKKEIEKLTLSHFKDGFSLIPIYHIAKIGEHYGLTSGKLMFRSFSDLVAEHVWDDSEKRSNVLNTWDYCFPENYELVLTKTLNWTRIKSI
ncbi:MAG: hypothetical protein HC836_34710 [Richelia sp. RM2_1_2]|nr:hypothetical protein [Richelia sp. RM2_1_2]